MLYETLTLTRQGAVAVLTLNRPAQMNAFTPLMLEELNAALDESLDSDTPARALLLTGAGRGFCAGADLATPNALNQQRGKPDTGRTLEVYYNPLIERLMALPIPVVTAVNGPAAGAGCSLALTGDIIVAARSAYFLQAFVNIGLVPDAGSSYFLPRLVGKARAQAMMMLGERVSAETALSWGMVYQVVEDSALMEAALGIATKLSKGPTKALGLIRSLVRQSLDNSLTQQLHLERVLQKQAGATADFAEGVRAFIEKRPARFTGQ
jgi:2-(1,2-epoxy-1,2-dihydrophenyl)acetyl-CoA isomerase